MFTRFKRSPKLSETCSQCNPLLTMWSALRFSKPNCNWRINKIPRKYSRCLQLYSFYKEKIIKKIKPYCIYHFLRVISIVVFGSPIVNLEFSSENNIKFRPWNPRQRKAKCLKKFMSDNHVTKNVWNYCFKKRS